MPAESTSTTHVNGIDLHYAVEGQGEPLLLLRGGGGCHENWAHAGRGSFRP
jgi:pimeloyl-ACP methyl ester carboxylesterase